MTLGVFDGRLQYDVFKGSNLIRQVVIAKTGARLGGVQVRRRAQGPADPDSSRVVWRDLAGRWQDQRFGGPVNKDPATVWSSNRLIAADAAGRLDRRVPAAAQFLRRARIEPGPRRQLLPQGQRHRHSRSASGRRRRKRIRQFLHNFALDQRAARHLAADAGVLLRQRRTRAGRVDAALTYTRGDHFKPLPGYQVMGSHYHVGMVPRLKESGSLDNRLERRRVDEGGRRQHLRHHRRRPRQRTSGDVPGGAGGILRRRPATVGQDLPGDAEQGESPASISADTTI